MDKVTRPKRFYKTAELTELGASDYGIALDGRPLRTPAKAVLALPRRALAQAVAEEWNRQGETLELQQMTLTRLANVALDRTPDTRDALVEELVRYVETDLICYLASAPAELRARQDQIWGPIRTWAGQQLGIVLVPVEGIQASPQPEASLAAARAQAQACDDFRLTGLNWACALFGSAILALGLEQGHLSADEAFQASCLDEDWQIEHWGQDEEAQAVRRARQKDAEALQIWFQAQ